MNLLTVEGEHGVLSSGFGWMVDGRVLGGLVAVQTHVADPATYLASFIARPVLLHTQVVLNWRHQHTARWLQSRCPTVVTLIL